MLIMSGHCQIVTKNDRKMTVLLREVVVLTFDLFLHLQVYQSATNDFVYFNKEFGRSVSVSGALEGEWSL